MVQLRFSSAIIWFIALFLLAAAIGIGTYRLRSSEASQAYLGAQFMPLTKAAFSRAPFLRGGALVINIIRDGPVDKAGIRANTVVAAIDGKPISSAREAAEIITRQKAGTRLVFTTYDIALGDPKPHEKTVILSDAPPPTAPLTVKPFRPLAKPWFPPSSMMANAAWSQKVSGAVEPSPLVLLKKGSCSVLAPAGWKISETQAGGFLVTSSGGNVKAGYVRVQGTTPGTAIRQVLADLFEQEPKLNLPRPLKNEFFRVDFGTTTGFNGYVLYRASEGAVSLWLVIVPSADTASLLPLVTSVALSVRCGAPTIAASLIAASRSATAVSDKCLKGTCDEGDLAGLYNSELRMGYVHSAKGENFLIDPRVSWQTGPAGAGYYRQVGGEVEKLQPGRTN